MARAARTIRRFHAHTTVDTAAAKNCCNNNVTYNSNNNNKNITRVVYVIIIIIITIATYYNILRAHTRVECKRYIHNVIRAFNQVGLRRGRGEEPFLSPTAWQAAAAKFARAYERRGGERDGVRLMSARGVSAPRCYYDTTVTGTHHHHHHHHRPAYEVGATG